jgi:hypothetical protein
MRQLILVASTVLLIVPGCGDDNKATGKPDMSVKADMATTPPDMTVASLCPTTNSCGCNNYENCYDACNGNTTCQDNCGKHTTQMGLDLDYDLFTACPMRYCNKHSDGGVVCTDVDLDPHATANITQPCLDCLQALNWDQQTFSTQCMTELANCTNNKP